MEAEFKIAYLKSAAADEIYYKICAKAGAEVADFILSNLSSEELSKTPYVANDWTYQGDSNLKDPRLFIDFRDANQVIDLNRHFSTINKKLPDTGIYIGCFESNYNRQKEIFKKYNRFLAFFILMLNYIFRNFVPMWKRFNKRNRYFIASFYQDNSLAETLGRLAFCGFEIINYNDFDNLTYFIVRKKTEPRIEKVSTSRFIVKLKRIGEKGKIINIYKIRSMYPFSEYIQDYVVKLNGYDTIGKPKNDFRLTSCGKIIRRLWIDEIPQFFNLIRGDIRVVGVRPISRYGFSSLPQDLQEKRIRNKPGLIPPHVSLRLKGFAGVIKAERQYLEERGNHPTRTDIKYFFFAVFNILTFRVKSS